MKLTRSHFLRLSIAAGALLLVQSIRRVVAVELDQGNPDPLPSWNDGQVKFAITDFVRRVTIENSPDFVPVDDRIATFDNDGTLWAEQPLIQILAIQSRLEELVVANPTLREKQPFRAALAGDGAYFATAGEEALMQVLALTSANQTDEEFKAKTIAFFRPQPIPDLTNL